MIDKDLEGKNISFDLNFFNKHGGKIRLFDPTESSIQHMNKIKLPKNKSTRVYNEPEFDCLNEIIYDGRFEEFCNVFKNHSI